LFNPVNRHILVKMPPKVIPEESIILLPEDYRPEEQRYAVVTVVRVADDVRFELCEGSKIIVDRSMIEQISIGSTNYDVILDNYVIGITD
tara:strand:+ start:51 stop:320 length:270 start_codon:yes stop_codon:yes gene_type:complete